MDGIRFKTKQISGIPGKVSVAIDEETGSVYLEQRMIISKNNPDWADNLKYCEIIREGQRYIVLERAVHFHRKTFGNVLGAIAELIERNDMMNKFPNEI